MTIVRRARKTLSGEQVRQWRQTRGMSQVELAGHLGVTKQSVAALERDGASQLHALAFSAIEAGLTAYEPADPELRRPAA